jgi:hypothetical protein
MNPLLEQRYQYIVLAHIDQVRSQLKAITKTPWYDIAVNLAGKVNEDNTFELYSKLSWGIDVFNIQQNTAIITGKLEPQHGEQTIIHAEVRPNYFVLFVLYLILIIFVFKLVDFIISGRQDWIFTILFFILFIILRSLIHFSIGGLKNRFERLMSVKPEQ